MDFRVVSTLPESVLYLPGQGAEIKTCFSNNFLLLEEFPTESIYPDIDINPIFPL